MVMERENTAIDAQKILDAMAAGEDIRLVGCQIIGKLDLNHYFDDDQFPFVWKVDLSEDGESKTLSLPQSLIFNSCTFESDVIFSGPWEKPEQLNVIFEKDVQFNSSVFKGQARFSNACFKGAAGFDGCTFCKVCSFRKAQFLARTMFRTVTFEGYGLFNEARFMADTRFVNTGFSKGANFIGVQFDCQCDFAGVYSRSKAVPLYERVCFKRKRFGDDESFWRFMKQASQEAGYYQQAGECFYRERCGHFWQKFRGSNFENLTQPQKLMRWLKGTRLLPELIFGRWLFGYGERPIRVLIASVIVIFVCGLFYSSDWARLSVSYDVQKGDIEFFEGLYYSTITFSTLGLGDIHPTGGQDWLTRLVTMIESLSGLCLISLFIVSLSKRFSRG